MPHHSNVWVTLVSNILFATRASLWLVVDAYVLFLPNGFGTNANVGIMEGVQGHASRLERSLAQLFPHASVYTRLDRIYAKVRTA